MTMKKGTSPFTLLLVCILIGLGSFSFGGQITSKELFVPEVYVACCWGSCFSPPHGTAYCFDKRNQPKPENYRVTTAYKTLFMRGKLIYKTQHAAVFLMYASYEVSNGFFTFVDEEECDMTFCSVDELRDADPEIGEIRNGDRICVIPWEVYKGERQARNAVRAIESSDVKTSLLECTSRNGEPEKNNRYPWW